MANNQQIARQQIGRPVLGLVTGMQAEVRQVSQTHRVRALCHGMGEACATSAAWKLAKSGVDYLVSFGCAGGLAPGLEPGDLIVPEEVIDNVIKGVEGARYACRLPQFLEARLGPKRHGVIVTTDHVVQSGLEKAALFAKTQAVAVDMESAAIAAVAREAGLHFFAVRVVADSSTRPVPEDLVRIIDDQGRVAYGRILSALLKNPALIGSLIALGLDNRRSMRRLKEIAFIMEKG